MSEYTPTTEHVRDLVLRLMNADEFDAWLAGVKADAWDEGWVSRHNYDERGGEAPTPNPYLEDRHVDQ